MATTVQYPHDTTQPILQEDINNPHSASQGYRDNNTINTQTPAGKEKNPMQAIDKLYNQNLTLTKEIHALSEQLPVLLEKEQANKNKKNLANSNVANGEQEAGSLQKELSEIYKQMSGYQKELKQLQTKYDASATYERYKDIENQIVIKERELAKLTKEKDTLEKLAAEKEKAISTLRQQTGTEGKVAMLSDELKELKDKLKQVQATEKKLEADAEKENVQIAKLKEELNKTKEAYRIMLEKTRYDPEEDKVRPKPGPNPLAKRPSREKSKTDKITKKEVGDDVQNLEFNPNNFQKIYTQVKELRRSEAQKDKDFRRDVDLLKERLFHMKKENEEIQKKLAEKEKEASILTIKLRELHRIARYHSILPLEEDEANKLNLKVNVQSKVAAFLSPDSSGIKSASKINSPGSITFPTKPKLSRLDSLNDYAKNNFLYTGYRKDERGKILNDGPGENFSDKELLGTSKPKIVGLRVWHDNRRVTGFQAVYKTQEGIKEGTQHVKNPHAYKLESFEMGGEDYLKEISGFTNKTETSIECLMLMSVMGETKKILEPNRESKLFKFDINEFEFPSIIYGYLKEETPRHYVTKFGILIASDNVEEHISTAKNVNKEEVTISKESKISTEMKQNTENKPVTRVTENKTNMDYNSVNQPTRVGENKVVTENKPTTENRRY